MSVDLPSLFAAPKTLPVQPLWRRRANDKWLRLVSPLDIDGITVEGFRFGASCHSELSDRAVTFQLEYHPVRRGSKGGPLCRIEWRPLSGHNNKGAGPPEFRYVVLSGNHHHPFELNWSHAPNQVRRGTLPIAIPILDELDSYREALAFVGKEFRINNVMSCPVPPWEGQLL
jgi:hypothetical protein